MSVLRRQFWVAEHPGPECEPNHQLRQAGRRHQRRRLVKQDHGRANQKEGEPRTNDHLLVIYLSLSTPTVCRLVSLFYRNWLQPHQNTLGHEYWGWPHVLRCPGGGQRGRPHSHLPRKWGVKGIFILLYAVECICYTKDVQEETGAQRANKLLYKIIWRTDKIIWRSCFASKKCNGNFCTYIKLLLVLIWYPLDLMRHQPNYSYSCSCSLWWNSRKLLQHNIWQALNLQEIRGKSARLGGWRLWWKTTGAGGEVTSQFHLATTTPGLHQLTDTVLRSLR